MSERNRRPGNRLLVVLVSLILLAGILFMARGLIRGAMSAFIYRSYKKEVAALYDNELKRLAPELERLGFTFSEQNLYKACKGNYSGFGTTYSCSQSNASTSVAQVISTTDTWQQEAKAFEERLLERGWRSPWPTSSSQESPSYGREEESTAKMSYKGGTYEKSGGERAICSLTINHSGAHSREFITRLSCRKYIHLFGGYYVASRPRLFMNDSIL